MNRNPKAEVIDTRGHSFQLGNEIGKGGEGSVFEVNGDTKTVAKIYHAPLTVEKAEKIRVMAALWNEKIAGLMAWPIDLLSKPTGEPVGFLMSKIAARKDVHHLYSPKSRRADFQRADWRFLIRACINMTRAFAAVHDTGCIIGDVNHGSILIGQDATVRLIDCDSFQVVSGARRFLCEVGVETFTPPELQDKSFKGVIRTDNHDNFGLAVMIFLTLFMGRHPFSGRYLGNGDMPISKAIEQYRFAYGAHRAALNMQQPPGTPPLAIVGDEVAALFEAAFAQKAAGGGRPGAKAWIAALEKLETNLRQCTASASHWYGKFSSSCPWCQMEAATGISLFPLTMPTTQGGFFDINAFWQQVEALKHPGPTPEFSEITVQPSAEAKIVRSRETAKYWLAGLIAAALVAFGLFAPIQTGQVFFVFGGIAAFFVLRNSLDKSDEIQKFRRAADEAAAKWSAAEADWNKRAGPFDFDVKKAAIMSLKGEWLEIPNLRLRKLDQLKQEHRNRQLEQFLDGFRLEDVKIAGIGPGRTLTLASYGIETAADIVQQKISPVPGFGPALQAKLLAWRSTLEKDFRFDPHKAIDPQDIAKVEQAVLSEKQRIELKLRAMLVELKQIHGRIIAGREYVGPQMEAIQREYAQAAANYKAVQGLK